MFSPEEHQPIGAISTKIGTKAVLKSKPQNVMFENTCTLIFQSKLKCHAENYPRAKMSQNHLRRRGWFGC